jgi:sugar O-acyltransferase (sialic acid O-acetyltransferase NeuD family)
MAPEIANVKLPRLLVLGSSGHAAVLLDAIELSGAYEVVGCVDDTVPQGTVRRGYTVLGGLQAASKICADRSIDCVVVAVGDNWWRRRISAELAEQCPALKFPTVKHPSAVIAGSAQIGQGCAILAGSHIGPGSRLGDFCIVNTGASLDHDCTMEDFSSVAPGVFTGGLVHIGECSAVGVGASVSDRISIGRHTVVGTGAVVVRNIPDLVVAYGNPAKVQRRRVEGEQYVATA